MVLTTDAISVWRRREWMEPVMLLKEAVTELRFADYAGFKKTGIIERGIPGREVAWQRREGG